MDEVIVFLPRPARRALHAVQKGFPGKRLEITRRGPIRTPIHARIEGTPIHVLTSKELSAELRARQDPALDPLAAFRMPAGAIAERVAALTGGDLRPARPDPVRRGLALTALVARAQVEVEDWEGREDEPARVRTWLGRHGGTAALSEVEASWLDAPVGSLPNEAWEADLPGELETVARGLGLVTELESVDVPGLLHAFGFLQDELPAPLRGERPPLA